MTSNLSTFDLAKQGDVNAIASLILQKLQSKQIVTQFTIDGGDLKFYVRSKIFSGRAVGEAVHKYIDSCQFNVESIRAIAIYTSHESHWKFAHRIALNPAENVVELKPIGHRKNNPIKINPDSEIAALREEFHQLKQSFQNEIQRLSQMSSQLRDALQKNTEENESLKARLSKLETPQMSPPPETSRGGDQGHGSEIPESTQLRQYLEQLNIQVRSCGESGSTNRVMNQIAVRLGKHYTHLSNLHLSIIQSISRNQTFYFNLQNSSQLKISHCTGFCQDLYDRTLLSSYFYDRNNQRISGQVDRRPEFINFLNGMWFEQFIYAKVSELLVRNDIAYECLINPHLEFENGNRFELDFLFLIGDRMLWIECKSGRHHNLSYARYENHKQLMQLPKDRSLLVLLQASGEQTEDLTQIRDLTIANPDNLIEKVAGGLNLETETQTN